MSTPDTTDNIYSKEETLQAFGGGTIVLAPGDVVEVYIVTDNNLPVYEATHTQFGTCGEQAITATRRI